METKEIYFYYSSPQSRYMSKGIGVVGIVKTETGRKNKDIRASGYELETIDGGIGTGIDLDKDNLLDAGIFLLDPLERRYKLVLDDQSIEGELLTRKDFYERIKPYCNHPEDLQRKIDASLQELSSRGKDRHQKQAR